MTTPYTRGNLSAPSKSRLEPARIDLSDVEIPHRNSSMKEPYKPPAWSVRDGADEHQQHKSRGV